ncbi:MAG: hypothetical protein NZ888_02015 [Candidatus Nitrosocaldus sp.]|nr:hypothetical protein [Candidatus Nitrosocaldus sp.]MDW7999977.1 hypothetical protein [Candidatus Nitrosocaldus sp.]
MVGSLITLTRLHRIINYSILSLVILFFIGSLELMPELYIASKPIVDLPAWMDQYWYSIPWMIFGLASLDIFLKYRKVGSLRMLMRKNWMDIIMLALIPFLFVFKMAKVSIKAYKVLKASKSWSKLVHLAKKMLYGKSDSGKLRE